MNIKENIMLSEYTSFCMGGEAKYLIEIKKNNDFVELFEFINKKKLPYFVLGSGTNTIFDDKKYNAIIIKLIRSKIEIMDSNKIKVDAGVKLSDFIEFCINNNLKGYELMYGIPGTVGGAIRGNAGSSGQEIKDFLVEVEFYEDQILKTLEKTNCQFEYRGSIFKNKSKNIITSAIFEMDVGDKLELNKISKKNIESRNKKMPMDVKSAGCFFKNPIISDSQKIDSISEKVIWPFGDKKIKVSAAWLIEDAGLKGLRINDIEVSDKHSLFIINRGEGKFEDLMDLMTIIRKKINEKYGIFLEPEVEIVLKIED